MICEIVAVCPSGNGRRIVVRGTDLPFGAIENVFVYPFLGIDRLKDALSRTLSFWPILTSRILVDDDQYIIELSDNSIPLTLTENDELERWPDLLVVVDDVTILQFFINSVEYNPKVEPLVRLKVTNLVRSGEYVLGTIFFSHNW